MSKARKEAQDQLRNDMQSLVTDKLQRQNQMLINVSRDQSIPIHIIEHHRIKLEGMVEAYRALGFRTDVFN